MTGTATHPARRRSTHLARLIFVYAAALGAGILIGSSGLLPFRHSPSPPDRLAQARTRVGWVLGQPDVEAPPAAWATLAADVAMAPDGWPASVRKVFQLLAVVRGLTTGGQPDWSAAASLCRAMNWSRCDRAALEQLRLRGRP